MNGDTQEVARLIAESTSAVAFTGAGISTESGIADFRRSGGIRGTKRAQVVAITKGLPENPRRRGA